MEFNIIFEFIDIMEFNIMEWTDYDGCKLVHIFHWFTFCVLHYILIHIVY